MERRDVLRYLGAGGAAVGLGPALAACTSGSGEPGAGSATAPASAGVAAADPRGRAAAVETTLIDELDALIARDTTAAALLAPVRSGHAAHVAALVGATPSPPAATSSPSTGAPATSVPVTAADLARLARRERSAARLHAAGAARPGVDPSDARLVASLAAFAAAQAVVIEEAGE